MMHGAKWTAGELKQIVRDAEHEAAIEVIKCLIARGPEVIDWDDDREACDECDAEPGRHELWCSGSVDWERADALARARDDEMEGEAP